MEQTEQTAEIALAIQAGLVEAGAQCELPEQAYDVSDSYPEELESLCALITLLNAGSDAAALESAQLVIEMLND